MLIAVAGASGRLGRKLVQKLSDEGYEVLALVRANSTTGNMPVGVQSRVVDYSSSQVVSEALSGATHIINTTGSVDTTLSLEELRLANVKATRALLEGAPSNLEKFIHIGSISVYGKNPFNLTDEKSLRNPDTKYGKTKLEGENLVLSYDKKFQVAILEPGIIYGPGFESGFYPLLKTISKNKMKLAGTGQNYMPLVHVDDVCEAIILTLKKSVLSGSRYLIVAQPQLTQAQLVSIAAQELGNASPTSHSSPTLLKAAVVAKGAYERIRGRKPSLTTEMIDQLSIDRCFSSKKAKEELGWEACVSFKMGVAQVVNQFTEDEKKGN